MGASERKQDWSCIRLPWRSSGSDSALPLQGPWVWSLVGELRSHKPQGAAKKKKRLTMCWWWLKLGDVHLRIILLYFVHDLREKRMLVFILKAMRRYEVFKVTTLAHTDLIFRKIMCTCAKSLQLCLTATPRNVTHQAPLSMGFCKQEYWSGLPSPPPGNLLHPGTEPTFWL